MEGSMYTFGSPLAAVRGFTALPGNTFALAVQTEEGGRVLHYVFDETVSAVPDKEVRVYALNDSPPCARPSPISNRKIRMCA